jgi:glycine cleavage system T protein (aminomethyltransferase)
VLRDDDSSGEFSLAEDGSLAGFAMPPDEPAIATDMSEAAPGGAGQASQGTPAPPLAEPLLDVRIKAATAMTYSVKAGQYIEIMDIDGRQCSDFLAFDAALLGEGVECGLDATATRTLTGRSYPGPGLYSKFYDQRMRPMLEVVQDTCGRHDTFAYACTTKYYDDMGYPGHDSCSENFNRVLQPFGIASRPGWPAINFFFNTFVNHDGTIGLDEPWSRPGDYVLLRALTDLVCATSSCADDIDPANGWNPTDIQVRVYDAANDFPKAIATRMTPDSPRRPPSIRASRRCRGAWSTIAAIGSPPPFSPTERSPNIGRPAKRSR